MLAKHPLLWTFAGGCLSGATLIGLWPRGEVERSSTRRHEVVVERSSEAPALTETSTSTVRERALTNDTPTAREEPGSSVADVLTRLEAEYRQGLSAAAAVEAPARAAGPVPAPPPATTVIIQAPPREIPAPPQPAAVVAAPPAPPLPSPQADAAPVVASREVARDVHIGDVNNNTHIGDVHNGDVTLVQQLSYFQVLGASPHSRRVHSPHTTHGATIGSVPFTTTLTNPDNPWGFNFPPPFHSVPFVHRATPLVR